MGIDLELYEEVPSGPRASVIAALLLCYLLIHVRLTGMRIFTGISLCMTTRRTDLIELCCRQQDGCSVSEDSLSSSVSPDLQASRVKSLSE